MPKEILNQSAMLPMDQQSMEMTIVLPLSVIMLLPTVPHKLHAQPTVLPTSDALLEMTPVELSKLLILNVTLLILSMDTNNGKTRPQSLALTQLL